jgi:hypothetical protein
MKKNFGFDAEFNKLRVIACSLWMGFKRGEGELEIEDQGRLQKSRFSQETEAIGQQTPRIGEDRPKLRLTTSTKVLSRVTSAGRTLNSNSTPQFFCSPSEQSLCSPSEKQFFLSYKNGEAQQSSIAEQVFFSEEAERIHTEKMDRKFSRDIQKTQSSIQDILKAAARDEDSAV